MNIIGVSVLLLKWYYISIYVNIIPDYIYIKMSTRFKILRATPSLIKGLTLWITAGGGKNRRLFTSYHRVYISMFHSTLFMRKVHTTEFAQDVQAPARPPGPAAASGEYELVPRNGQILTRRRIPCLDTRTAKACRQARIFNLVGWESLSASTVLSIQMYNLK